LLSEKNANFVVENGRKSPQNLIVTSAPTLATYIHTCSAAQHAQELFLFLPEDFLGFNLTLKSVEKVRIIKPQSQW
jgi:hypothetical protein